MARAFNKLTDIECKAASKSGLHGDGGGLYLNVKPSGSKSWVYVWKQTVDHGGNAKTKRTEMGLGSYPVVKLSKARLLASECRVAIAEGRNPLEERKKDVEPTFGECADLFLASMESQWRNEKHRAQWRSTLEGYAGVLRPMRVSAIGTDDVLRVLSPIWRDKAETASRLRGRIERVLDYAKARGWRSGENPALWRGHLKSILPTRQKLTRGHHPAMRYGDLPAFVCPSSEHLAWHRLQL
ncbi:tyrosine-type recombinase/integrase [Mesorhizobium sp. 10J20-29]